MIFDPAYLRLYFIMGSNNTDKDPAYVLKQAIKGGIAAFQYREKGTDAKIGTEQLELGYELRAICKEYNVPFIVNDSVELALHLEADGLHIGQSDGELAEIRQLVPNHCFIGVSTSTVEEAIKAERDGADYIGVGPIFKTITKEDALLPIGIEGLREIREKTENIPIVAISGVTEATTQDLLTNGANGIAVISAISQAENVYETTKRLKK